MNERLVHLIIRTAGERTFEAARYLAAEQVGAGAIDVVAERPFEMALRKTFEVGLQRGARWTMTLDADVLLRKDAIAQLLKVAEDQPDEVIQIEGRVLDKLTGEIRSAGHRLYRTCHLHDALRAIPEIGTEIRPEYSTLQRLAREGFRSRAVAHIAGLHDFDQYYRDIYRKTFVHANKHTGIISEMIVRAKALAGEDWDFRVALKGLYDGLLATEVVRIDANSHADRLPTILAELGVTEKPAMNSSLITSAGVERLLAAGLASEATVWDKFGDAHRHSRILEMLPRVAGAGLFRVGSWVAGWGLRLHTRSTPGDKPPARK